MQWSAESIREHCATQKALLRIEPIVTITTHRDKFAPEERTSGRTNKTFPMFHAGGFGDSQQCGKHVAARYTLGDTSTCNPQSNSSLQMTTPV
ncbi:hypothetical protein, partial [Escherichia coli]|uniref:hypothetical protein n=1 Tax=Escherichia coli TaxID=562 RepID=UPI001BDBCAEA